MEAEALQIHRSLGRLRVRSLKLKRDPTRALDTNSRLIALQGVHSVELNPLTGSLLIHFDPNESTSETLVQAVLDSHKVARAPGTPVPGTVRVATVRHTFYSRATRRAAKIACAYASEKIVEHLIVTLLAALL